MSNPIGWFEIYVQDMERAKAFYTGVFKSELTRMNSGDIEMWGFPSDYTAYGSSGALVHMPGMPSGGNSTVVYFSCDDCALEESRVVESGGKIFKTKFSIGEYGFISLASDSEGNMIGLHSQK